MDKKVLISIVIVNYRTAQLTINCLESISEDFFEEYLTSVIVADNDSRDGSTLIITDEIKKRGWNSWASVMPLEKNGGFAYGNNRVIEKILDGPQLSDYLWLLNPDTVVHKGACRALVEFLSTHPVGIAGSRLEDPDGTPQVSSFRDHTVISEFLSGIRLGVLDRLLSKWLVASSPVSATAHQADWVSGASMMVRREIFEKVGLLDEQFFMYFEEVDFCIRARKAGWKCWYVPKSRVLHLVGAASGISDSSKKVPRRPSYWFESRRKFFLKNHGWFALILADLGWIVGYSTWRIRRVIQRKPDLDPPHFLKDFFRHSFFCKGFRL